MTAERQDGRCVCDGEGRLAVPGKSLSCESAFVRVALLISPGKAVDRRGRSVLQGWTRQRCRATLSLKA